MPYKVSPQSCINHSNGSHVDTITYTTIELHELIRRSPPIAHQQRPTGREYHNTPKYPQHHDGREETEEC